MRNKSNKNLKEELSRFAEHRKNFAALESKLRETEQENIALKSRADQLKIENKTY